MEDKINQNIKQLQDDLITAGLNYEIWWIYKEKESRKRYVDTLNSYKLFFVTSLHAHFVAMILPIYRIYEKRKDSINIYQLIEQLKKVDTVSAKDLNEIENAVKRLKPLWIKVSVIRNKIFAHRSNALDNDAIWKDASVSPIQFKNLIDESKMILNNLSYLWNKSSHIFNQSATKDTIDLLEDFKQLREKA